MRSLIVTLLVIAYLSACREREPEITKTYVLSQEMMEYFVNYAVGTKWVYQDTIDKNNYDTIELLTKQSMDVNLGNGTLSKGFVLYYKPIKSKDYKIFVHAGVNNTYYVEIDPLVAAAGKIVFENINGIWTTGVTYYDSIEITGNKYYQVIYSKSNNMYQYEMRIAKNGGIVFFLYSNSNPQNPFGAAYKLIKTIKP
ncbi:MAG: hypothetical protein IT247_03615 [Bacteroidia bacterium]|nr:hypothetical protein [Bacteroidia bacterium]